MFRISAQPSRVVSPVTRHARVAEDLRVSRSVRNGGRRRGTPRTPRAREDGICTMVSQLAPEPDLEPTELALRRGQGVHEGERALYLCRIQHHKTRICAFVLRIQRSTISRPVRRVLLRKTPSICRPRGTMRVRVDVEMQPSSAGSNDVFGPARELIYALIRNHDSELARTLHDHGWMGASLRPVGATCLQFPEGTAPSGAYRTPRRAAVWFGSPVPTIATAMIASLRTQRELPWGKELLTIRTVAVDVDEPSASGQVELQSTTPVLLKYESRYLDADDPRFLDRLEHNLARKADLLRLPRPTHVVMTEAGPHKPYRVQKVTLRGAVIKVRMKADAEFVRAIRSWGLGLNNNLGFGWVR